MNLLALRIGRNHNYWVDSINNFFSPVWGPRSIPAMGNSFITNSSSTEFSKNHFRSRPSFLANSLFNYEMGAGSPVPGSSFSSFFYYSNSYGLYFFLPLNRTLFFNTPFVGLLGNLFKSFFSTRVVYNQSFILPHSDIDYLLNLFVFRFRHQKSFSNTLDLLQAAPTRAEPSLRRAPAAPLSFPRGAVAGWRLTGVNGLKIVCNGRLNLRSLYNSPRRGSRVVAAAQPRSKSFEFKWGHIPNNSSKELDIPIHYRFKPFFTQKGSNSLKLLISYKVA